MDKDETSQVTFLVGGLSAEYQAGPLRLGGEVFVSDEVHYEHSVGAHLTAAWWFDEHWQLAGRLEGFQTWVPQIDGITPLQRHREGAAALNYWFSPGLVVKGSVHQVSGNRFVYPTGATYQDLVTSPPARRTTMVILGTQFAF